MEDKLGFIKKDSVSWAILLLLVGQVSTFTIKSCSDDRRYAAEVARQHHLDLKENLSRKNRTLNNTADALTQARITRSLIRERCKFHPQDATSATAILEANERRIKAVTRLIEADEQIRTDFGTAIGSTVGNLIHDYDVWDLGMDNVCAQSEQIAQEYYDRAAAILKPMRAAIAADEIKLNQAFRKLQELQKR